MSTSYPLAESNLAALGFAAKPLDHLDGMIQSHIAEGRYPGAQIALARNGKLGLLRTYGNARTEGGTVPATNETLFLLFSQTKVLTLPPPPYGRLSRKASCRSWIRSATTCRSSPRAARAT